MLPARFTILSIADVETRVASGDRTALGLVAVVRA